jgi:hypothetical protein
MQGRKKDAQKGKVQKAEAEVFAGLFEPNLPEMQDCHEFMRKILLSKWFEKKNAPFVSVIFKDGRQRHSIVVGFEQMGVLGRAAVIEAPRNTRLDWQMLHQLCHLLSWRGEPHDRNWCRLYLSALKRWMGVEWERKMRVAFVKYGVHWHHPHVNIGNKVDMRYRMSKLREKKEQLKAQRIKDESFVIGAAVKR